MIHWKHLAPKNNPFTHQTSQLLSETEIHCYVNHPFQVIQIQVESTIFGYCIVQISLFQPVLCSRMHAHWRACSFFFFFFFFLIVYLTSLTECLLLVGETLHFTLWRTPIDSSAQLFCPVVNRLSLCCSEWLQRSVFGPRRRWRPRYGAVSDPAVCLWYRVRHQRVGLPDECGELVAKQLPRWHLFTDLNSFKQISIHKSIK